MNEGIDLQKIKHSSAKVIGKWFGNVFGSDPNLVQIGLMN
jgi:hypothetical protein